MTSKAFIQTYGCQMNEHDSFRMMAILSSLGFETTDVLAEAALILVNTCSVRRNPENKVYSFLGSLKPLKKRNPALIVGVAGCVAQQEGERILKRARVVDIVFGPDNYFRLPEMIAAVRRGERVVMTDWLPGKERVQNFIPEEWLERGHVEGCKAYIAISKGCGNLCSFCIVPRVRGREVSREPDNILREARDLIDKGAKEIWLLGQNVNSYRAGEFRFRQLLDAMSQLDIKRLRFTSPHPKDWPDDLSDLMASRPVICNQLHLPLQAGADRILTLMNRRHTIREYLDKVAYMKSINPGTDPRGSVPEISTDIIVGFPTETEAEFEETLRALEEVRFSQVYSFKYSPRPGTKAEQLDDDVPRELKEERLARLIAVQERINTEQMALYVGSVQEILIDGAHPKQPETWSGRTDGYRPVSIPDPNLHVGDIVDVRITGINGHWLLGETAQTASERTVETSGTSKTSETKGRRSKDACPLSPRCPPSPQDASCDPKQLRGILPGDLAKYGFADLPGIAQPGQKVNEGRVRVGRTDIGAEHQAVLELFEELDGILGVARKRIVAASCG